MMQPPDIHILTGAYAVDALPDEERELFEAHLDVCEACAEEVTELQATAARLGETAFVPPSNALRARVLAEIDATRQEPPAGREEVVALDVRRPTPRWVTALVASAAAVLVVGVVGLGFVINDLNARLGEVETSASRMTDLLAAPDARTISAEGPNGSVARLVVSPSRGEAMFVASEMEPAPQEHTYELWVHGDNEPVKAGLFDVDPDGTATHLLTNDLSNAVAIGVTVEPEGGSPQPSGDPVMVLELEL